MKRAKRVKRKAGIALSLPTLLCFVTFIADLIYIAQDGRIDLMRLKGLLSSAQGFEIVLLCLIMIIAKKH